jgi:hypothetical protein
MLIQARVSALRNNRVQLVFKIGQETLQASHEANDEEYAILFEAMGGTRSVVIDRQDGNGKIRRVLPSSAWVAPRAAWHVEVSPHETNDVPGARQLYNVAVRNGDDKSEHGFFQTVESAAQGVDRVRKALGMLSPEKFSVRQVSDVISQAIQDVPVSAT